MPRSFLPARLSRRRRTWPPRRAAWPSRPGRRCSSTPRCPAPGCSRRDPWRARGPGRRSRCRRPSRRRRTIQTLRRIRKSATPARLRGVGTVDRGQTFASTGRDHAPRCSAICSSVSCSASISSPATSSSPSLPASRFSSIAGVVDLLVDRQAEAQAELGVVLEQRVGPGGPAALPRWSRRASSAGCRRRSTSSPWRWRSASGRRRTG